MKKYLPVLIAGLGIMFLCIAMALRSGAGDMEIVIANLTSTFMFVTAAVCFVGAIVTFCLRDDETVW
jgi:hypothetical protein